MRRIKERAKQSHARSSHVCLGQTLKLPRGNGRIEPFSSGHIRGYFKNGAMQERGTDPNTKHAENHLKRHVTEAGGQPKVPLVSSHVIYGLW